MQGKKILFGITGSSQAMQAVAAVRQLAAAGAQVHVMLSADAGRFVPVRELAAMTGYPVITEMFGHPPKCEVDHIREAEWAECLVLAPLTVRYAGQLAQGIADEMLTTSVLAVRAPQVLWAPQALPEQTAQTLTQLGYLAVAPRYLEGIPAAICRTVFACFHTEYDDAQPVVKYLEGRHG